jgi:hypothetical protein
LCCFSRRSVVARCSVSNAKDPAPLKVKEVWVRERRYIVCLNEEERRKDAHDCEVIVAHLQEQLRSGDKSLVGNKGYRRYLKVEGSGHFVIDEKQIKATDASVRAAKGPIGSCILGSPARFRFL